MIITIGGQKGGTGKTTTAINLTTMRVLDGHETLLYDIDKQMTATLWASMRDYNNIEPRISSTQKVFPSEMLNAGIVIINELKDLTKKYENIIIDAGGADNEVLRGAISRSDMVIFPIEAADFSFWTFNTLNTLIAHTQGEHQTKHGYILLNELSTNPGEAKKDVAKLDDLLIDFEYLKRFESMLCKRRHIKISQGEGYAIVENTPTDSRAVGEINAIYQEVFNVG